MPLYGKKDADFMVIVATFFDMLAQYPSTAVCDALVRYMRNRSEFPTVSDIIGIIEGRVRMDKSLYAELRKKRIDQYITQDEKDYIAEYERRILCEWGE